LGTKTPGVKQTGVNFWDLTAKLTATGLVSQPKCYPFGRQRFA